MDQDPRGLSTALLQWVNSFEFARSVETWRDLQDGQILWQILAEIEPDYFPGSLPETYSQTSENWIPRWQNLKYINRMVMSFIRDECGKLNELSKRMKPDLKAIAIDASAEDSIQLLKAVLLAAMYSPLSNQRMVQVMQKLGPKVAIPIATCIGAIEQAEHQLVEADSHMDQGSDFEGMVSPARSGTPQLSTLNRDPELEREERLIQAYSRIRNLEERSTTLSTELEATSAARDKAQDEMTEMQFRLEQGGQSDANKEMLESMRQKATRDRDYITELEADLTGLKSSAENTERQLERLKAEEHSKQDLRDEIQFVKLERDDLLQKSKASENLKKKIQSLQDSDKDNQTLRQDFEAAKEELRLLRPLKDRCSALQKANEEKLKTIQNGEQEIFDQKTTRKRLDHELRLLSQKWEAAREKQQRDSETMKEQEEKISELESGRTKAADTGSLEDEFTSTDKARSDLKSKVSALEAENTGLRAANGIPEDDTELKKTHQMLQARLEKMEKQYLDMYQENLGLDSALKDAEQEVLESRPFLEIRDRLRNESLKLAASDKQLFDAEAELSNLKVELESATSKLSVIDKNKSETLDELKRSAETGSAILQTENNRLLQHAKLVEGELEEQRSLLRHALLDKNAMLREDTGIRERNEFLLVGEQLKTLQENAITSEELATSLARRIEQGRDGIRQSEENAAEASAKIESHVEMLQDRLRKAEDEISHGIKTPAQENMQRELALMTSAWYDVTSRMQSDAVVVQRRGDTPRSFLNKQRKLLSNPSMTV